MNVPVTPLALPIGFCPATYQDMWNTFAASGQVTLPDALSQIVWQATAPADQTISWGKVDSLGRPVGIFRFAQGAWLMPHPDVPGKTVWWFGALPDFTTFDGGDANLLSAISGPMWQQAKTSGGTLIAAQFPIVAGTLPSGLVLNSGDTGGEEKHTLDLTEMPSHGHLLNLKGFNPNRAGNSGTALSDISDANSTNNLQESTTAIGGDTNSKTVGHNNMPPYVVGYLLQRTQRLFYIG